ncbi:MAG TPA: GNAT family N-acetyltransferase, partial [Streptosporangiaceae bacterium]
PRHHRPAHPQQRNNPVMTAHPTPAGGALTTVVTAEAADLDALSEVIADAFHPLAPSQWLIPDDAARRDIFPAYFRIFVEHALAHGTVHTVPDRSAAALWFPVGPDGPVAPDRYAERLTTTTGPWAHRFRAFEAALDSRHPVGIPHQHLAMLAVHPSRQGHGIGTALLRAHHHTLDHDARVQAYLEASDLRTRQLYLHEGYTDHGPPIRLPGGPRMYPMLRRHHQPKPS